MFGWRKRIGYIGPTVMEVVPYEFYRFAPDGVGLVGVTCNIDDWSAEWFDRALAQVSDVRGGLPGFARESTLCCTAVARLWPRAEPASIKPSSTTLRKRPAFAPPPACGRRATRSITLARSVSLSLHRIRSGTISAMSGYLTARGFDIAAAEGMDVPFKRLQSVTLEDIRKFAESVLERAGRCDALYLPCPQWQAAQIVDELERAAGIPIIAYCHASFFMAFKARSASNEPDRRSRPAAGVACRIADFRSPD